MKPVIIADTEVITSASSVPYKAASNNANLAASNLVESTVTVAVGLLWPVTSTGVVENSQENVIASGESLIVS